MLQNVNPSPYPDMLTTAHAELKNVARRDEPSVLRNREYSGLRQEKWMAETTAELSTRCPTVAKILSMLLDCDLSNPGKKLPPMCLIYGIIMFLRCHELSRIQRVNTILLTEGKATTNVSLVLIEHEKVHTNIGRFCIKSLFRHDPLH